MLPFLASRTIAPPFLEASLCDQHHHQHPSPTRSSNMQERLPCCPERLWAGIGRNRIKSPHRKDMRMNDSDASRILQDDMKNSSMPSLELLQKKKIFFSTALSFVDQTRDKLKKDGISKFRLLPTLFYSHRRLDSKDLLRHFHVPILPWFWNRCSGEEFNPYFHVIAVPLLPLPASSSPLLSPLVPLHLNLNISPTTASKELAQGLRSSGSSGRA